MLVYVALFVTSMLLVLAFVYWSTMTNMRGQIDETIEAEVIGLAERFETSGLTGMRNLITQRVRRDQPTSDSIYLFTDSQLRRITGNLNGWPNKPEDPGSGWIDFELIRDGAESRIARARVFELRGGYRLLVGRDIHTLERIKRRLLAVLGWAGALTLGLGILGAFMMTRSMMRRIEAINATSDAIVRSGDLSRRIPQRGSNDDLDRLSGNLNGMLHRIEELMTGVRQVSDSIAHDLRTPLTRLRNRLELARIHDGSENSQRETVDSALEEVDDILNTFNALLRISRIETGDARKEFGDVDINDLCQDVLELYDPVAESHGIKLGYANRTSGTPLIHADRDLVFQAIANVIDNAIKFSQSSSTVTIDLDKIDSKTQISISDTGPGIPKELHDRVFERFYRGDKSRGSEGNGLGLALVKAVCRVHDADVALTQLQPGLRVTVSFETKPTAPPGVDTGQRD